MKKEKIGIVTEFEKNEIMKLYQRKIALNELTQSLKNLDVQKEENLLYEKIIGDIGSTNMSFDNWWKETSEKYQWKSSAEGHWEIDFNTKEIFLVSNN